MPKEWNIESYLMSVIERWQNGTLTADETVREIRTTLLEEKDIRKAENNGR